MLPEIKRILSEKKGAVTVLLMCIMGSFILITGILVAASVSASGKSYADATLQLAGKSILSEYDRKLLDEYGLLCFRGDEKDITKKLKFYGSGSFDNNRLEYTGLVSQKDSVDLLKLNMEKVEATLKEYSMINVDLYEEQLKEALKTKFLDNTTRSKGNEDKNRTLRNEIVIDSLPSAGYEGSIFPDLTDASNIPNWEEITNTATDKFARCEYAMKMFKHANNGDLNKETFFNNEIEYILEGKFGDTENYNGVKAKILAARFALNSLYLLSDRVKMGEITALASSTGPATPAAEAAIFMAWVGAETDNDIDLLESGKNVAIVKTRTNWALNDIAKIMDGLASSEKAVQPINKRGQSYGDYLRVLLYLEDREAMLLRMMDLTQINMKGNYYRDFLLKEHYCGFRFNTTIKGDTFNYVQQY